MEANVSPQELQDIVDQFGDDPKAWPKGSEAQAEALIDDCAEARAIMAQAKLLRILLRDMGAMAPSCFSDRIVALALEIDPPRDDFMRFRN
jgi:hypothetical protein